MSKPSYWQQPVRDSKGQVKTPWGFGGRKPEKLGTVLALPFALLPLNLFILLFGGSILLPGIVLLTLAVKGAIAYYNTNKWWTGQERSRLYGARPDRNQD